MNEVADAIRKVTARMQRALDTGQRSRNIDADDLIEALLAVADEIEARAAKLVDQVSKAIRSKKGATSSKRVLNRVELHRDRALQALKLIEQFLQSGAPPGDSPDET